ncbi:hypothetical protein GCK32_019567 [Trichostrongylus colubriformis]|uniref:Uncharacterized protein n=1 Tax=Trichostrongylus colubriformis TaxID=6319 RepID=A0AAN8FIK8_TRICO
MLIFITSKKQLYKEIRTNSGNANTLTMGIKSHSRKNHQMSKALVFLCILALHSTRHVLGGDSEEHQPIESMSKGNGEDQENSLELEWSSEDHSLAGSKVALNDQGSSEDAPDLLVNDGDSAVVRSKRYYGCGCFNCNCATMVPATYAPCGGCCGCGGYG